MLTRPITSSKLFDAVHSSAVRRDAEAVAPGDAVERLELGGAAALVAARLNGAA